MHYRHIYLSQDSPLTNKNAHKESIHPFTRRFVSSDLIFDILPVLNMMILSIFIIIYELTTCFEFYLKKTKIFHAGLHEVN